MNILIACEFSGIVRDAFLKRGHNAWSCDFLPTESEIRGFHYQCDIRDVDITLFDLMIAFPPCTDLCVSGARHFPEKRVDGRQQKAIDFFMFLVNAPIPKIAIENPVGIMSTVWRKPDQIIQPYQFGHDASKKTCLWLKNLTKLEPTGYVPGTMNDRGLTRWANQTASGQNNLAPSQTRGLDRSRTYRGIADAMAEQWGIS